LATIRASRADQSLHEVNKACEYYDQWEGQHGAQHEDDPANDRNPVLIAPSQTQDLQEEHGDRRHDQTHHEQTE